MGKKYNTILEKCKINFFAVLALSTSNMGKSQSMCVGT